MRRTAPDAHPLTKLVRLHEELGASRLGIPYPSDIEERFPGLRYLYHETDSLLGAVNYLRSELTKAFKQGQTIDPADLDHLYDLSRIIDDRPGMLKAALLRNAVLKQDTPGIAAVLEETEWTAWYRRRWLRRWKSRAPWE